MKKNIFIVILIMIILGLGGYLVYDKFLTKEEKKPDTVKEVKENDDSKLSNDAQDYDLSKAEELLDEFGFNDNVGCGRNVYSSIYNDTFKKVQAITKVDESKVQNVSCSKIYSDKDLDSSGYYRNEYGACKSDASTEVIPYDEVNEIYNKMYGTDVEKKGIDPESVGRMYFHFYDYNEALNAFVKLDCDGCGGACNENQYLVKKIKSATLIGNELIIDIYYLSGEPHYNEYTNKNIYNLDTLKIQKTLEVNDAKSFENEVSKNYIDKLDIYEVVFEKNGDNYIFKTLSKKLS